MAPPSTETETLPVALAQEAAADALAIWQAGCDAGLGYLADLAASRRPQELIAANARLFAANASIYAAAAGAILQRGGVREPLLNDA